MRLEPPITGSLVRRANHYPTASLVGCLARVELVMFTTTNADIFTTVCKQYFNPVVVDTSVASAPVIKQADAPNTSDVAQSNQNDTQSNNGDWYEVERVIRHRKIRGKDEYLVKWKDYDEQSWVRRENLTDGALQAYYANRRPRRRRRY